MRRRDFVTLIAGGAGATWPIMVRAQQPAANVPVVTLINGRRADAGTTLAAEFRKGLSQTGLTEGKGVVVEYHCWTVTTRNFVQSSAMPSAAMSR